MLRREAANWLARLQSGRDPDAAGKFRKWHDADPRHAAAFDRVKRTYEQAGLLRQSSAAVASQLQPATRQVHWTPRLAIAATAALLVLFPVGLLLVRGSSPFGATDEVMLMTSVGEIREVDLADGSRVTLDTQTRVDVEIGRSRRSAHLRYGRARFQVAQSAEPFVVDTPKATVIIRDAMVDVEQIGERGGVQVLAGAVEVRGADQALQMALGAGENVTVNARGPQQKGVAPRGPDWTRGMLQFDGTPLADAAALANRYSRRHIILAGNLNGLRVTGAFRAGDTAGLAKALAAAFGLSLQQRADGNLVLSRALSSSAPK